MGKDYLWRKLMENDPHLEILRKWLTPDEFDQVRKAWGSAEDIVEHSRKVRRIIEKAEHQEAIWTFLKRTFQAFAIIVGVLATIKAIAPPGWWP